MKGLSFFYGMVVAIMGLATGQIHAQQIAYSIGMNDNIRTTTFDIIGACGDHLMIYKKSFNDHAIALYDRDMKVLDIIPLGFLPKEVKGTSFVNLGDKIMMIYEYARRRHLYCEAVLLDEQAKPLGPPHDIDRTSPGQTVSGDNAYSVIYSEDKSKIMVIQALRDADSMRFQLRSFLLDTGLHLLRKDSMDIPYLRDSDRLDEMMLSNSGDLYFILGSATYVSDAFFSKLFLYCHTTGGMLYGDSIPLNNHLPDRSVLLNLDNIHHKAWLTTLNYDDKGRDINYLFTGRYRMGDLQPLGSKTVLLDDSLKNKLKSKGENARHALNYCTLRQQIIDLEENVLVVGEKQFRDVNGINHYDALVFLSLDSSGSVVQAQKIQKEQAADLSDAFSSYLMINTGGALHFLMNKPHKIFRFINNYVYLLADYRYDADRQLKEMPVFRGQDNKKRWAPRYGMQISRNEVVIPCQVGTGLIFGKITY